MPGVQLGDAAAGERHGERLRAVVSGAEVGRQAQGAVASLVHELDQRRHHPHARPLRRACEPARQERRGEARDRTLSAHLEPAVEPLARGGARPAGGGVLGPDARLLRHRRRAARQGQAARLRPDL
eukprot:scaffold33305_cov63-Phaeocystis_antarctica.AAC.4